MATKKLTHLAEDIDTTIDGLTAHADNSTVHTTSAEKATWNAKVDTSTLNSHTSNGDIHTNSNEKDKWNTHIANSYIHVTTDDKSNWNGKVDTDTFTTHTSDGNIHTNSAERDKYNTHIASTGIHVTSDDKTNWNNKADDSDFQTHISDGNIHTNSAERDKYNTHINASGIHVTTDDKANWNAKAEISDIPTAVSELTNDSNYMTLQRGTSIPSGADLNDYTTFGVYYSDSATISQSLSNTPCYLPSVARLEVFATNGTDGTYLCQRLTSGATTPTFIWERVKTTSWSPWHLLNGNDFTKFYYDSSDYASAYIKVATYKMSSATNCDYVATFNVQCNYNTGSIPNASNGGGVLKAHIRRNSTTSRTMRLTWLQAGNLVQKDDWIMTYDETNLKCELWKKISNRWESYTVTLLSSSTRVYNQYYDTAVEMYFVKKSVSGGDTYDSTAYTVTTTSVLGEQQFASPSRTTVAISSGTGNFYYKKQGDSVDVYGSVQPTSSSMTLSLGTLPSGYRPPATEYFQQNNGAGSSFGSLAITSDGAMTLIFPSSCSTSTTYNFHAIFMI